LNNSIKISCCSQVCNRLWQLKETFRENLEAIESHGFEWCILDYNSTDGIQEFVLDNASKEIKNGTLKFGRVLDVDSYDLINAKNIASLLSSNEILFNLDIDNFISKETLSAIQETFTNESLHLVHNWSEKYYDGTFGRIAVRKSSFLSIHGYAEDLIGVGVHDDDLIRRVSLKWGIEKIPFTDKAPIANTKDETVQNLPSSLKEKGYEQIRSKNQNQASNTSRPIPPISSKLVELYSKDTYPIPSRSWVQHQD